MKETGNTLVLTELNLVFSHSVVDEPEIFSLNQKTLEV